MMRCLHSTQDLITSETILKVGVNIVLDMRKLLKDFGSTYAARGVVDLSHMAKALDVGLVGTKLEDLESNRANIGIGVKKIADPTKSTPTDDNDNVPGPGMGGISDEDNVAAAKGSDLKINAKGLVGSGRQLIALAKLVRRYLGRELAKGEERTSNWDQKLTQAQIHCEPTLRSIWIIWIFQRYQLI
jgi:hypothetical protein